MKSERPIVTMPIPSVPQAPLRGIWPALLTVVFYLWDAVRTLTVAVRRDPRWVWQFWLLGILAIVVVGWNLALR